MASEVSEVLTEKEISVIRKLCTAILFAVCSMGAFAQTGPWTCNNTNKDLVTWAVGAANISWNKNPDEIGVSGPDSNGFYYCQYKILQACGNHNCASGGNSYPGGLKWGGNSTGVSVNASCPSGYTCLVGNQRYQPGQSSYTPTIAFAGGGSGDTESLNVADWQQVSGEVTLDGQITFSSLGSRSGGITFGLPSGGLAPYGVGPASVDSSTAWTATANSNGIELFDQSGNQLSVSNLTSTSVISYHIGSAPYSSSWTPALKYCPTGGGSCSATGVTYTTDSGTYQVAGSQVTVDASVTLSNKGSGSGCPCWATLTLPFPVSSTGQASYSGTLITNSNATGTSYVIGSVMYLSRDNTEWESDSTITNTSQYIAHVTYYK